MKAVAAGALPAERFKFFYKTVEFLPNALAAQIASGVYRVIELSPAWLFGQFGQRSMWQDVRKKLERAEAREIRAKGGTVAPLSPAASAGAGWVSSSSEFTKTTATAPAACARWALSVNAHAPR